MLKEIAKAKEAELQAVKLEIANLANKIENDTRSLEVNKQKLQRLMEKMQPPPITKGFAKLTITKGFAKLNETN